jgi:outer membrane lipopolysaccharide assembly protein LptE/RlpB
MGILILTAFVMALAVCGSWHFRNKHAEGDRIEGIENKINYCAI